MSIQTKDGLLDKTIQSKTDKTIQRVFRVFDKTPVDFGFLDNAKIYAQKHFEKTKEVLAIELVDLDLPKVVIFNDYQVVLEVCPTDKIAFIELYGIHTNGSRSPLQVSFHLLSNETIPQGLERCIEQINNPSFEFVESFDTELGAQQCQAGYFLASKSVRFKH
jgi:hypothetical protein